MVRNDRQDELRYTQTVKGIFKVRNTQTVTDRELILVRNRQAGRDIKCELRYTQTVTDRELILVRNDRHLET